MTTFTKGDRVRVVGNLAPGKEAQGPIHFLTLGSEGVVQGVLFLDAQYPRVLVEGDYDGEGTILQELRPQHIERIAEEAASE